MTPLDDSNLVEHLQRAGFGVPDPALARVERAGEGNINFVRRVWLGPQQSVIVKHARPSLERFPQYQAPVERLLFEARYAQTAEPLLAGQPFLPPRILHFDPELPWLVLEDLGPGPDLHEALDRRFVPPGALRELGRFLARVHRASAPRASALAPRFANRAMQELHGEHIFTLPYAPDAFQVAAETRAAADELLADAKLMERIRSLRSRYYGSREALVHADVQSSNLLLRGDRLRLLDAEIAHVGDPAFDLGTALAHVYLHMALSDDRPELRGALASLREGYAEQGGTDDAIARAEGYAGVEMLRRTIGAARFPGVESGPAAVRVLTLGAELIRRAEID